MLLTYCVTLAPMATPLAYPACLAAPAPRDGRIPEPGRAAGARFETGSPPVEALAGFIATAGYLESVGGMDAIASWETRLAERFVAGLPPETVLYGLPGAEGRIPVFLLNLPGVPAAEVAARLAERGFGVWSGTHFYALGLYERLNWGEALRVGIAHYNSLEEVDQLTEALRELVPPASGNGVPPLGQARFRSG